MVQHRIESVECEEEGMTQEKFYEEEMVQNRPIEDNQKVGIQQRVECDKGRKVECNGERLQERQQHEVIVQYRMIERDDGELAQERKELFLRKQQNSNMLKL